jgi:tetratricopeptide (TPR) repeat protein
VGKNRGGSAKGVKGFSMKSIKLRLIIFSTLIGWQTNFAQTGNEPPPTPARTPLTNSAPKISVAAARNLEQITGKTPVSRERREQAYAKLLESQRHIWAMRPSRRSPSPATNNVALARQALHKAVELNPLLAEAYTALAELTLLAPPYDLEEAVALAGIAAKIEPGNFGARRILARLYTIKSRGNGGTLDPVWAQKAISEWKEVARLDPRNAEAFAFLSDFYTRTKMPAERIDALRKWLASATPLDPYFYSRVMGDRADLSPEGATVKYGQALLESGETREAIEVLSRAVADNSDNEEAVEQLRRGVESADAGAVAIAVPALQQAVYANPENISLVEILTKLQMRTGKQSEALEIVRSLRARNKDNYSLLRLEAKILADSGKTDEAVALVKSLIGKKASAQSAPKTTDEDGNKIMLDSLMFDDFSNYLYIANLYSQARRGKEAVEAVNQALAATQNPERKEIARLTLATVQQTNGDFRGAEETLRGILANTPRNPIALNNLGYFLTERDEKLDEALRLIEQAVEIDPANPSYLDSLGWAYFKLGNLPEAEKYLKAALQIDDSSSTIHEHLGDVYQKQGKPDAAKAAWRKALTLASETDEINRLKTKLEAKNSK